jgi:single-strand DNA-binding protein
MNVNRVFLAGNLTRDVAVRFLAGDKAVGEFGLAINRKWKDGNGEQKEEVTFVDVEVWGKTAELCAKYLAKGSGCFLEGRLKLDTWEDKKDGSKRSKMRVVAESVQFVGGRQDDGEKRTAATDPAPSRASAPAPTQATDEPPF